MRNHLQNYTVQDVLENILNDSFFVKPFEFVAPRQVRELQNQNLPFSNIYITPEKDYVIEAALSGIPKESIDLNVQNRSVEITIDVREDSGPSVDTENQEVKENIVIQNGIKSFTYLKNEWIIPKRWDTEKLQAEYKDGLLRIKVPLKEEEVRLIEKRKIAITSN